MSANRSIVIARPLGAEGRRVFGALALGALFLLPERLQARQSGQQDVAPAGDSVSSTPRKRKSRRRRATRPTVSRGEIAPRVATLSWTSPRGVESLNSDLGAALSQHTRSGQWGVMVVSLSRGDTLFESRPDAMMQPASTMKMYTSALALDRFGPEHQFRTSVLRELRCLL